MATIMHYLHVACDAKPSCWPQRSNSARPDGSLFQGDSRSQQRQLTSSNWRPCLSAHSRIANTLMHSAIWCASRHSPAAPHEGRISLSRIQNSYFSLELQCSTLSPCWKEFIPTVLDCSTYILGKLTRCQELLGAERLLIA